MSQWIVETNQLTKRLGGKKAVDGVNLRIGQGEVYGFLGPNGAGKTTTIRMLLGLARPTKGDIRIFGKDLKREKLSILRKVGSLVEYPSYYGHLTGRENLEAVRRILDVPKQRIDEVLSIVRLMKDANRTVKGYSLGMKQRLGIATALLGQPELLILDEPTNGLDPSGILEIRELIKTLARERGMTVLVSSHLLSEIDQMATQVGIISKGRLIFQDSIALLREKAKSGIEMAVDRPEEAGRLLLSVGCPSERTERGILFEHQSDDNVAAVVKFLVEQGIRVYRVMEKKASLEDVFLQLTGGEGSL